MRRSAELADAIEADIEARSLAPGYLLGSELELCEKYGVSRPVLREAVRLLEHYQLARMRTGRRGGLVVAEPDIDALTGGVARLLRRKGANIADLVAARRLIEGTCVRLAAERITTEGIKELRDCVEIEEITPANSAREHSTDFHRLTARLSGNPALDTFTGVLLELTSSGVARPPITVNDEVLRIHRLISEVIIAGDGALAQHYMNRHFDAMAKAWQDNDATFPRLNAPTFTPPPPTVNREH